MTGMLFDTIYRQGALSGIPGLAVIGIAGLTVAVVTFAAMASQEGVPEGPPSEIRGQVLLPDGSPAADVPVIVHWRKLLAETRTSSEGRFRLGLDPEEVIRATSAESWRRAQVAAFADGYGPGWELLGEIEADQEVKLPLVEDVPIRGRILDQQGRPVHGATVRLLWLHDEGGELDGFLQATRDRPASMGLQSYTQENMKYLNPGLIAWIDDRTAKSPFYEVTTDEEGRLELRGIGRERSVYVHISGPGIATQLAFIVTRPEIDARWKRGSLSRETKYLLESGDTIPPVFPGDFTYLAAPGRTIRGTLRDAATGEPAVGMGVSANIRGTSSKGYQRDTGEDGKYEIHGLLLAGRLRIAALNTGEGAYLEAEKTLQISGDEDPGPIDFSLDQGVRVWGTVLDEQGDPVKGRIGYLAWHENPQLKKLSEPYEVYNTQFPDKNGDYAIVVPPGPGVLTFTARDRERYSPAQDEDFGFPLRQKGALRIFSSKNHGLTWAAQYTVLQRIEPDDEMRELHLDLTVHSGRPVVGKLVTSAGGPVRNFRARGLTPGGVENRSDGIFRVRGLEESERRHVYFRSDDLMWAAIEEFTLADAEQSKLVKLQRTGTIRARLTDAQGKPLSEWVYAAGTRGILAQAAGEDQDRERGIVFEFAEGGADADGFFYAKGIPSNVPVEIIASKRPAAGRRPEPELVQEITLRPGQNLDLGEVRLDGVDLTNP